MTSIITQLDAIAFCKVETSSNESNTQKTLDCDSKFQSPSKLKLAHHLRLDYGVLVEIYQPNNPEIHQRLGRVAQVFEKTVDIWRRDMETMEMKKYRIHHHQARVINLEEHDDIAELNQRICNLRQAPLEPIDRDILDLIARAIPQGSAKRHALSGKKSQSLIKLGLTFFNLIEKCRRKKVGYKSW